MRAWLFAASNWKVKKRRGMHDSRGEIFCSRSIETRVENLMAKVLADCLRVRSVYVIGELHVMY